MSGEDTRKSVNTHSFCDSGEEEPRATLCLILWFKNLLVFFLFSVSEESPRRLLQAFPNERERSRIVPEQTKDQTSAAQQTSAKA